METIFLAFSNYILILFMAVYTFQCFYVFKYSSEEERDGIYLKQVIAMSAIYLVSFTVIFLKTKDTELLKFYGLTQVVMWCLILLYRKLYPEANKLLVNNMCMLISIGFIILTRLDYNKARKQFVVVLISIVMALVIPYILKKFKRLRRFYRLFAAAGMIALTIVLFFSRSINGSKLNIKIGGVSFQA